MRKIPILLFFVAITSCLHVCAQNNASTIKGEVKDARSNKPLIEAVITLSSTNFDGKKFIVTDSTGNYHIPDLAAGLYTLVLEMEGFDKLTKDNVVVAQGKPLDLDLQMTREKRKPKPLIAFAKNTSN